MDNLQLLVQAAITVTNPNHSYGIGKNPISDKNSNSKLKEPIFTQEKKRNVTQMMESNENPMGNRKKNRITSSVSENLPVSKTKHTIIPNPPSISSLSSYHAISANSIKSFQLNDSRSPKKYMEDTHQSTQGLKVEDVHSLSSLHASMMLLSSSSSPSLLLKHSSTSVSSNSSSTSSTVSLDTTLSGQMETKSDDSLEKDGQDVKNNNTKGNSLSCGNSIDGINGINSSIGGITSSSSSSSLPILLCSELHNSTLSLQSKKDIFKKIMHNFNTNDVMKFQKVLQRFAKESVIISSQSLRCESIGFTSLLIFWVLILEGYPDAVISNICTKEISRNCCEYSFSFIGTRITAHPVTVLYSLAADKLALGATVTPSELLNLVTRSSLDSSLCAPVCPFVSCKGRSVLTYDDDGKISRWYFDMKV